MWESVQACRAERSSKRALQATYNGKQPSLGIFRFCNYARRTLAITPEEGFFIAACAKNLVLQDGELQFLLVFFVGNCHFCLSCLSCLSVRDFFKLLLARFFFSLIV